MTREQRDLANFDDIIHKNIKFIRIVYFNSNFINEKGNVINVQRSEISLNQR